MGTNNVSGSHFAIERVDIVEQIISEIEDYAIFMLDVNGYVVSWNLGAEKIKGYSAEEVIGKHFRIFYPQEDIDQHFPEYFLKKAKKNNKAEHIGWRIRKDGSRFWGNIILTAIHNEKGEHIGFTKITRDLTQQREREEALMQSEERFRKLLEASPDATIIVNGEGNMILVNTQTENIFGYSKNELLGKEADMLLPDAFQYIRELLYAYPTNIPLIYKKKQSFEVKGKRKDSSIFPIDIALNSIGFDDEILILVTIRDITERKKNEENIHQLNETLEGKVKERTSELEKIKNNLEEDVEKRTQEITQSKQELEAFSYSVSHDLRAPLRAISGYSSILVEDYFEELDAEGQRIIKIINRNVIRMQNLIDEILNFSRLNRRKITRSHLNMRMLFEEAYQNLKQAEVDSRSIDMQISDIPDATGDATMVSQTITNLLSNALKYSRPKEHTTIRVGSKKIDNETVYFVEDNGVGFDEQFKDKLFEVFQRLHKDAEFEGNGVGLAIVQQVVHKHGGKVWGEGKVGQGATFYFTLPKT